MKYAVQTDKKPVYHDYTKAKVYGFAVLAVLLVGIAVFASFLCPYDPNGQNYAAALQPPSAVHVLGTDRYGRDMLSRVIMGTQASVLSAGIVVAAAAVIGTSIGAHGAYFGGMTDTIIMRLADVCLAFPSLVFALAVTAVFHGGIETAMLALLVIGWPKYARLARSQTLMLKEQPFMAAAQLAGTSPQYMMLRHILPNIGSTIMTTAVLDIGTVMMELAALSFLGLGAKPPLAEWGSMMNVGRSMLQTYPWVVFAPGAAIFIAVSIFNLLGDSLRDYWDTRRKGSI